jgi:hypothetical protein
MPAPTVNDSARPPTATATLLDEIFIMLVSFPPGTEL